MKTHYLLMLLIAPIFLTQSAAMAQQSGAQAQQLTQDEQRKVAFIREWMNNLQYKDSILFAIKPLVIRIDSDLTFEKFLYGLNNIPSEDSFAMAHAKERVFSDVDMAYIRLQIQQCKQYEWKPEDFKNKQFISDKKITDIFGKAGPYGWKWFRQRHLHGFHSMSVPLFSLKGDRAFFYEEFSCGGLCGEGGISIYQLVAGKWQRLGYRMMWMS